MGRVRRSRPRRGRCQPRWGGALGCRATTRRPPSEPDRHAGQFGL